MCGRVTQFSRWDRNREKPRRPVGRRPATLITFRPARRWSQRPPRAGRPAHRSVARGASCRLGRRPTNRAATPTPASKGSSIGRPSATAARLRRCVVPLDGYYEWKTEGKLKVPYYFRAADGGPLAVGGLWSLPPRRRRHARRTLCLVTVAPNREAGEVHSRMPVVLTGAARQAWLSERAFADAGRFRRLAVTAPDRTLCRSIASHPTSIASRSTPSHLVRFPWSARWISRTSSGICLANGAFLDRPLSHGRADAYPENRGEAVGPRNLVSPIKPLTPVRCWK